VRSNALTVSSVRVTVCFNENQILVVGAAEKAALKNGGAWIGKRVGRPRADLSLILDALFYRLRNAGPWRDLPERFGPWQTVHGWHNRWAANGLWTKVLKTLTKRSRGRVRLVDGSHVPVHQSGCNPTKSSGPAQMGKTRGGRNTKIMALTDWRGRVINLRLIEGQAYEGHHVVELIDEGAALIIVGDKGFDDDKLRAELRKLGHVPQFPGRKSRKHKVFVPKSLYRVRYRVENFFCRLKRWGSAATRRDKLAVNYLSLISFASAIDWLKFGQ
jgi:transposase